VVAAVHAAVEDLIGERGLADLTIGEIADRAGVNPTSIYRRWGTLEALVLDVEMAAVEVRSPIPDTGSLRGDLHTYATGVAREVAGPGGLTFLRAVLALGDREDVTRSEAMRNRADRIERMMDRARERGEPAPHWTAVQDCILAPLYLRVIFGVGGLDEEFITTLVDRVLATDFG